MSASRCTGAPIAAVATIGGTGRSGRRSATSASISLATGTAPAYAVAIGTDAAERRFGNNPGSSLDEKKFEIRNPGDVWSIATRPNPAGHFAIFPPDIPLCCIQASNAPGDLVLVPSREQERPASWSSPWVAGSSESNSSPTTPRSRPSTWISAGFDAHDGTANSTWVHSQVPGATLPGVVQPRDAGFTYIPEDELGGLNPTDPVVGWAALSTGEQLRTKPITLRSW